MPRSAVATRAEHEVVRLCHSGLIGDALRREILPALRRLIPIDAAFFATADPETLLFTGAWPDEPLDTMTRQFLDNEFGCEDVNKFADLATTSRHVATLDQATHRDRADSERYRDIMRPIGLGDELRAALVAGDNCWGYLCLHRADGQLGFSRGEAAALSRVAPHIAQALRTATLLNAAGGVEVTGPGIVVLDDDLTVVATTPQAEHLLSMVDDARRLPLPSPVYAVARALQAVERGNRSALPSGRLATAAGSWLNLSASRLSTGQLAVVVESVEPRAAASLLLTAHGLSPRESEVARLVLRGRPTWSIAAELHISAHTVQDHLKGVFDKVGVRSRRELVGKILGG